MYSAVLQQNKAEHTKCHAKVNNKKVCSGAEKTIALIGIIKAPQIIIQPPKNSN